MNIPGRAPHFVGLWQSSIKANMTLLRKTVGSHRMTVEELMTVLTQIEATLNSRPLIPMDSPPTDGALALTPGHFLVGRPLQAIPSRIDVRPSLPLTRRWNLCQHLSREFWRLWSRDYIGTLNRYQKWAQPKREVHPGDVVLVKDQECFIHSWPLARVVTTHPGQDGRTRVATIQIGKRTYQRPIHRLVILLPEEEEEPRPFPGEDGQA